LLNNRRSALMQYGQTAVEYINIFGILIHINSLIFYDWQFGFNPSIQATLQVI